MASRTATPEPGGGRPGTALPGLPVPDEVWQRVCAAFADEVAMRVPRLVAAAEGMRTAAPAGVSLPVLAPVLDDLHVLGCAAGLVSELAAATSAAGCAAMLRIWLASPHPAHDGMLPAEVANVLAARLDELVESLARWLPPPLVGTAPDPLPPTVLGLA